MSSISPRDRLPVGNDGQVSGGTRRGGLFGHGPRYTPHFGGDSEIAKFCRYLHQLSTPAAFQSSCNSWQHLEGCRTLSASLNSTRSSRTGTGCCAQISAVSRTLWHPTVFGGSAIPGKCHALQRVSHQQQAPLVHRAMAVRWWSPAIPAAGWGRHGPLRRIANEAPF